MEEPIERKDAAVGIAAKEPLKTEGLVPSPDTSERSEGASSPPPNCSICLGKLRNTSFTDSCLHQFCFTCLLQWSKIKTECPLCKQTFKSIIHNVRSEEDYDQYHVPRGLASQLPTPQIASLDVNFELVGGAEGQIRRFVYRTTMTPNRRQYGVTTLLNHEQVARREQIPNMMPPAVSREERRFRLGNPTVYRRNVYQQGEWSNFLPDIHGHLRECSAEYYRRNPHELNRLIPWINRELQILLNANESHIAYVLNVITDSLSRYDIRGPEFRDTVRPYFGPYTDHFAHELLNYARTSFDLVGYDQYVTYPTHGRGLSSEYVGRVISPISSVSSTSSDDSDVRVVDQTIDVSRASVEMPSVGPHVIDMPGPSTVGETFQVQRMTSVPDILTISSGSSSSDECEVVGYVKPRHERTPEIIELVSSDGGADPTSTRDASCRSPLELRENVSSDRPGPSHDSHRRATRKSVRQNCTSSSATNDESSAEPSRRHHKKSSYRSAARPRAREASRKTRATEETERPSPPARSRSETRRRQDSSPSRSPDLDCRRSLRRGTRDRAQTFKKLGLTSSDSPSDESCRSDASRSSSSNSSRDSSVPRSVPRVPKVKLRKSQAPKRGIYSSSSSNSSKRSSSSSSSSSSASESETAWSGDSSDRRRLRVRSRRKLSPQSLSQPTPAPRRQPVNATILRKDSSNPNEWYVKKKTLRLRSRSRSSSSCLSETEPQNPARRSATDDHKDRKDSASGNPGCSRSEEKKGARTKREPELNSSASESKSDVTIESNSRGNGISGRTRAKERSRHKDGLKRRRIRSESSDSGRTRPVGGARRRDQESRGDQAKRKDQTKRSDHGRKRSRSSRVSDQAKRNDHDRNNEANRDDHARKRGETSKTRDQERKTSEKTRKLNDQVRKTTDHDRKTDDQARKTNDQERKRSDQIQGGGHVRNSTDQERKSTDQERKSADQERKKSDHSQEGDQGRKSNDQASRKKDHGSRRNDNDQAGTSRHSENEKKSISKDKHKSKKKQKAKRRRSRSESKSASRSSRHRMERSSSYSPTTNHHDDQ